MSSKKLFHAKPSSTSSDSNNNMMFEFDESDLWNSNESAHQSDMTKKTVPNSRSYKKLQAMHAERKQQSAGTSLPVNIPDRSKILKDHHEGHNKICCYEDVECNIEDFDMRIPPHEYLARTRGASFSVHEGIGRTLKGRDLSRVRNAIWKKTGFED